MLSIGISYLYYRPALFVNSMFTVKPVLVNSVFTVRPVFVNVKGLRVFQKNISLRIFCQSGKNYII